MPAPADYPRVEELMLHFDAAVAEVFEQMLGMACLPIENAAMHPEKINVIVRFLGEIEGRCHLYLSAKDGRITLDALVGDCTSACDSMVDDAVGELCNMIVGSWKSRLAPCLSSALLSVPATSRRSDDGIDDEFIQNVHRNYNFQGSTLGVVLSCQSNEKRVPFELVGRSCS